MGTRNPSASLQGSDGRGIDIIAPACQFDPGSKEIGVAIILLAGEGPKALLPGLKNRHRRDVTANGRLTSLPGDAGSPSVQRAA